MNKPLILMFGLFTVVLGILGFALQPTAAGPPVLTAESQAPVWNFSTSPEPVRASSASEQVIGCGQHPCPYPPAGHTLVDLDLSAAYGRRTRVVDVTIQLLNYEGPCPRLDYSKQTPPKPAYSAQKNPGSCIYRRNVQVSSGSRLDLVTRFLLPDGTLYAQAGSYASVEVPGVQIPQFPAPFALQQIFVDEGGPAVPELSMLSGPGPKYTTPYNYTWLFSQASTPALSLTLTSLSGVESDSRKAFLSGIALGVAGAALIGLAEELIRPLGDRKKSGRNHHVPSVASGVQAAAVPAQPRGSRPARQEEDPPP